jgi:AcrR family transcriptional regulator
MEFSPNNMQDDHRKSRSDGVQSRERLLLTAMRLFAEQGFAATSTRGIAIAAGTNIASISYYFGDKAGLYRAAFTEPAPHCRDDIDEFTNPALPLSASWRRVRARTLPPSPIQRRPCANRCRRSMRRCSRPSSKAKSRA